MKKLTLPFRLLSLAMVLIIAGGMLTSCGKNLAYDRYDYELNEYVNPGDLSQIEVSAKQSRLAKRANRQAYLAVAISHRPHPQFK